VNGRVILYADRITDSMRRAIDETERRRKLQQEFNMKHGITPQTVHKNVHEVIEATRVAEAPAVYDTGKKKGKLTKKEIKQVLARLEKEMREAARRLEFEQAAQLRDAIIELRLELRGRDKRITPAVGDN